MILKCCTSHDQYQSGRETLSNAQCTVYLSVCPGGHGGIELVALSLRLAAALFHAPRVLRMILPVLGEGLFNAAVDLRAKTTTLGWIENGE
jgi:hypothetical protein